MQITNCRGCGRIFNALADEQFCPNCQKKLDEKFDEVKRYIEENPDAPVEKVSRETDTSMRQIRKWVREERLSFSKNSAYGIECENCGRIIHTGRFCDECKRNLANALRSAIDAPKSETLKSQTSIHNKMRYFK